MELDGIGFGLFVLDSCQSPVVGKTCRPSVLQQSRSLDIVRVEFGFLTYSLC